MQANAGLVQHVHHARQARADLAGEPDALRLAARQGFGTAVQAQIVQAHVVQKLQTQAHFAHHFAGNFALGAVDFQVLKIRLRFAQSHVADLKDGTGLIALADQHMARFAAQA